MRDGLKVLITVLLAGGIAACEADGDVETFEGEEAATPELETPGTTPGMETAILTARFEAPEDAPEANQVTGMVRIFPESGFGTGAARPGTGATAGEPGTTGDATPAGEATGDAGTDARATTGAAAGADSGFRVEVELNGLSQGEHAWHIHSGPCNEQAPIEVAFSPTPDMEGLAQPLQADQSGRVQSTATVPSDELTLNRLQSGEFSLHVHAQGGTDFGPTVACADLNDQANTTM